MANHLEAMINELKAKRKATFDKMSDINKVTVTEKRALTGDERTNFENLNNEFRTLDAEIKVKEDELKLESKRSNEFSEIEARMRGSIAGVDAVTRGSNSGTGATPDKRSEGEIKRDNGRFLRAFMTRDYGELNRLYKEQRTREQRTDAPYLHYTLDAGGALIVPMSLYNGVLENKRKATPLMDRVNRIAMPEAMSLGIPTLESEMDDFTWTREGVETDPTKDTLSRDELKPHLLTKTIQCGQKLAGLRGFDVEAWVFSRAEYKKNVTVEQAILTGDGIGKPLGLANTPGKNTVDAFTGTGNTLFVLSDAINIYTDIRQPYRTSPSVAFVVGGYLLKGMLSCVDGEGRPLYLPSLIAGEPDRFLGKAVIETEFLPLATATVAGDDVLGYFGDLDSYWMPYVDVVRVKVLDQTGAKKHLIEYVFDYEIGGQLVLPEAITEIQHAG
jgi:HK97 family phage major capsid protein